MFWVFRASILCMCTLCVHPRTHPIIMVEGILVGIKYNVAMHTASILNSSWVWFFELFLGNCNRKNRKKSGVIQLQLLFKNSSWRLFKSYINRFFTSQYHTSPSITYYIENNLQHSLKSYNIKIIIVEFSTTKLNIICIFAL